MKCIKLSAFTLSIVLISLSAEAHDKSSCSVQETGSNQQEHVAQLANCLGAASSPENVRKVGLNRKRLRCEQNAKNLNLEGVEKGSYLNSCVRRNEAAEVLAKSAAHA